MPAGADAVLAEEFARETNGVVVALADAGTGRIAASPAGGVSTVWSVASSVETTREETVVAASATTSVARALDHSHAMLQTDAPACDNCGAITVRNGTCYKCMNCGNSMGCS